VKQRAGEQEMPGCVPGGIVWVLALGAFASSGMSRVIDPLLPRLEEYFSVSLSQAAWALTAFVIAYGVMQVVYGPLADRRGKLHILRVTSILAALAAVGCALSFDSLAMLVLTRFAAGAFCAASIPLAVAWIGDHVAPDRRKTVLARFMIGQMLGMASGQLLGGFAAEQPVWSWPFGFYAVIYGVVAAMLWWGVDRTTEGKGASKEHSLRDGVRVAMRDPYACRVLVASFAEGLTFLGAFAFLATHLHREGGIPLSRSGLLVTSFSVGGLGFALSASRWLPRFRESGVIVCGSCLCALGMFVVAFAPTQLASAAAIMVGGVGFYMVHNTLQAGATHMMPGRRGAAITLFSTAFFLGQSAGVAMMGSIADHFGTSVVLVCGAIGIACVGAWLRRGLESITDVEMERARSRIGDTPGVVLPEKKA
jgi:MFS family permease